jgi:hypothetical protein
MLYTGASESGSQLLLLLLLLQLRISYHPL